MKIWRILAAVAVAGLLGACGGGDRWVAQWPTRDPGERPNPRPTAAATETPTPRPTPTRGPTPQGLPVTASLGDDWTRPADGMVMVYVPAGTFLMGTPEDDPLVQDDETPQHPVTLSAFWIDRTEVTNAQFSHCVAAGKCVTPFQPAMEIDGDYFGNPQYDVYPVVNVSWVEAQAYCEWAGGTLPTEAQWEYAARGPESLVYPWGGAPPDETLLNYGQIVGSTAEVGSYPHAASWCGALDMSGNVWEWTADWYGPYPPDPQTDPLGPEKGSCHVLHSGSWFDIDAFARAANRYCLREAMRDYQGPVGHGFNVGFRCVVLP